MTLWRDEYHAEAEITLLATADGGRQTPILSGYRGQFHYPGEDGAWVAEYVLIDPEQLAPGETGMIWIWFMTPEAHRVRLRPGAQFEIREGHCLVAQGRITWLPADPSGLSAE